MLNRLYKVCEVMHRLVFVTNTRLETILYFRSQVGDKNYETGSVFVLCLLPKQKIL